MNLHFQQLRKEPAKGTAGNTNLSGTNFVPNIFNFSPSINSGGGIIEPLSAIVVRIVCNVRPYDVNHRRTSPAIACAANSCAETRTQNMCGYMTVRLGTKNDAKEDVALSK